MAAADPGQSRILARQLSLGGLLTAFILILLVVKVYLPTGDLALLCLTSLCLAVGVIELDLRPALVIFAAAALLSLAWPGIAASYAFIFFFGPYPLIRALIDKTFGKITAALLKLVAGNILVALAVVFFAWSELTIMADRYTYFWLLAPVLLQAALLAYDYILGLLIQFYVIRVRRNK